MRWSILTLALLLDPAAVLLFVTTVAEARVGRPRKGGDFRSGDDPVTTNIIKLDFMAY
jgi:hypothetical protein